MFLLLVTIVAPSNPYFPQFLDERIGFIIAYNVLDKILQLSYQNNAHWIFQ